MAETEDLPKEPDDVPRADPQEKNTEKNDSTDATIVREAAVSNPELDTDKPVSKLNIGWSKKLTAAVAALVLLASVIIFVTSRSDEQQLAAPLAAVTSEIPKLPTTDIKVGSGPSRPVSAGGFIWVTNTDDETVSRIDPETGEVTTTIDVGSDPRQPVSSGGFVWVANTDDGTVSRIDPETGEVTTTIDVGNRPETPAANETSIVIPDSEDGTLTFINPEDASIEETVKVGPAPSMPTISQDEATVTTSDGKTTVVNLETKDVVISFETDEPPVDLLRVGSNLWTAHSDSIKVFNVEDETSESIPIDFSASQLIEVDGLIWAKGATTVSRVDPVELAVVDSTTFATKIDSITQIGDTVWAALVASPQLLVLDINTVEAIETTINCPGPSAPLQADTAIYVTCAGSNTMKQIPMKASEKITIDIGQPIISAVGDNDIIWLQKEDGSIGALNTETSEMIESPGKPPEGFGREFPIFSTETTSIHKGPTGAWLLRGVPITDGTYSVGRGFTGEPLRSADELLASSDSASLPNFAVSGPDGTKRLHAIKASGDAIAIDDGIIFSELNEYGRNQELKGFGLRRLIMTDAKKRTTIGDVLIPEELWAISNGYLWVVSESSLVGRPYSRLINRDADEMESPEILTLTSESLGPMTIGMTESEALATGLIEEFEEGICAIIDPGGWSQALLKSPYEGLVVSDDGRVSEFAVDNDTVIAPGETSVGMSIERFAETMRGQGFSVRVEPYSVFDVGFADVVSSSGEQVFSAQFDPGNGEVLGIGAPSIRTCD